MVIATELQFLMRLWRVVVPTVRCREMNFLVRRRQLRLDKVSSDVLRTSEGASERSALDLRHVPGRIGF